MRVPRIYQPINDLAVNQHVKLDEDGAAHIGRVLRMTEGENIRLFTGNGNDYLATIISANKKTSPLKSLKIRQIIQSHH